MEEVLKARSTVGPAMEGKENRGNFQLFFFGDMKKKCVTRINYFITSERSINMYVVLPTM